ncbi:hypothetical protein HanIR_Chr03g0115121 [Helianthus annuus]|nr:hypothetical protein HanIR_Chr03g0115121 [Helianthus annuus]
MRRNQGIDEMLDDETDMAKQMCFTETIYDETNMTKQGCFVEEGSPRNRGVSPNG